MSTSPVSARSSSANWRLVAPWGLVTIVSLLALYVWAASLDWHFGGLSTYQVFPVLGLLAWSIMWTHYMAGYYRRRVLTPDALEPFFHYTSYAVLVLIVLHPGLLIYQRFRDGFGLPPHSYETYVAPSMAWLTLLGTVSLLIFLAFELHRWFKRRDWWQYVLYANDIAMLAIFYHGLRLGTQLHVAWFRWVWWFYGLCLVAVLILTYVPKLQHRSAPQHR